MGSVYRIVAPDGTYYIGSTTQSVHKKIREVREANKTIKCRAIWTHFDSRGWDKAVIEVLEKVDDRNLLQQKEHEWLAISDGDCINVDVLETYIDHKREKRVEYKRTYFAKNREMENLKRAERRLRQNKTPTVDGSESSGDNTLPTGVGEGAMS